LKRYMYLDPSLGRSTKSDYSAIVIIDHEPAANVWWVVHADIQRRRPQKLVNDYLDLWQRFSPDTHATEDEGAQELLLPIFAAEIAARKLPANATPRLQSSGGVSKVQRIKRLSPLAEFGQLRWDANGLHKELRAQLTAWQGTPNETDDGPDALEGCVRLSARPTPLTAAAMAAMNA
jgi:predicted phage terminase large subunit-like protein